MAFTIYQMMKFTREIYLKGLALTAVAALCIMGDAQAQIKRSKVAVKTNLLYDATATVNLGVEVGLARQWTIDISANYNAWTLGNDRKYKHILIQPEGRFWLCERFKGHFFGVHAHWGTYNFANLEMPFGAIPALKDFRYQGDIYGAGITYGYQWYLGRHWNLEAALGVGYARVSYDKYPCAVDCGNILESGKDDYFGPTKLAVSLVYLF